MSLIYNATFDKNTRKLSFEDKAGNEIYSFTVPERTPAVDDLTKPLTLRATQDGSTVKIIRKGTIPEGFQTSRDGGNTWTNYSMDTAIRLNTGDEVSFRADLERSVTQSYDKYFRFEMAGKIEAWHNVMSMLRPNYFVELKVAKSYAFYGLFGSCTSLTRAPALPATTLGDNCYKFMFSGCQSLTKAPELPATTLADSCYYGMFQNCQSLTKAPALPATELARFCYWSMFSGCQSLTKAPELPATTLADNCYENMFERCQSLTKAPELPATTLAGGCYHWMFDGCQSLNEVRISATTTATNALTDWLKNVSATGDFYCDPNATIFPTDSASGIPKGWTRRNINLLNALTLTATADNSSVKLTKNGTLSNTFEVDTGNGWTTYEFDTVIPLNAGQSCKWRCSAHPTTQSYATYVKFVMTGTIEASGDVSSMLSSDFKNITSLSGYKFAFCSLFEDCKSLTQAPPLPATTLASSCYSYMFNRCERLTQAPELPAKTLVRGCYYSMFSGCQSLKEVRVSATTTATDALTYWLYNVSATGDFYCDPNATIFPSGESGIPANWNRHALADYPATP